MANTDFVKLVGAFMHHCGALELLTNNAIRSFSRDPILSADVVKAPLSRRIDLLRHLLRDRSKVDGEAVDYICDELKQLSQARNKVAHNPILDRTPNGKGKKSIIVLRYNRQGASESSEIDADALSDFVNRSRQLMTRFASLVPEATETP